MAGLRVAIDLAQEVGTDQIVCVEHCHHVICLRCRLDAREEPANGMSLADEVCIRALIDNGTVCTGYVSGLIGTVVRDDVDIEELTWIFLPSQRIQHVADDVRLVVRRYGHGKPRDRVLQRGFAPLPEPEQRHDRLVCRQEEDTVLHNSQQRVAKLSYDIRSWMHFIFSCTDNDPASAFVSDNFI